MQPVLIILMAFAALLDPAHADRAAPEKAAIEQQAPEHGTVELDERLVATRQLHAGEALQHGDIVRADGRAIPAVQMAPFLRGEVKRSIAAGVTLTSGDIAPRTLIERNSLVTLEFTKGPLHITTQGRALNAGSLGQAIRVMNADTKSVVSAVIIGENKARVQ